MSLKITLTAIICYQCTRKDKILYSRFKSPDMNNSVSSRQDECHVNHSRLPQAIYLYSSTLLALSNDFSKSFTQQRSSHFTIHIKGVKKSEQEILLLSRQRGETTQNSTISQQSQPLVCGY